MIAMLCRHYVRDLLRTRLFLAMAVVWIGLLVGGTALDAVAYRIRWRTHDGEQQALQRYYAEYPNHGLLFHNFYTVLRPLNPLSTLVAGTQRHAPDRLDYRPRFSPDFYYSDDVDPLVRLLQPFDLTLALGLIGMIIACLLCHDALNGEVERRNAHALVVLGAKLADLYLAKVAALALFLGSVFLFAYGVSLLVFFALVPRPDAALLPGLGASLAAFGVVGLVYLVMCVAAACCASAWFRRRGSSFLACMALLVLSVYVVPFVVVELVAKVAPLPHSPAQVLETKILSSRELHVAVDTCLDAKDHVRTAAKLDSYDALVDSIKRESAAGRQKEPVACAKGSTFLKDNSKLTIDLEEPQRAAVMRQSRLIERVSAALSPYTALSWSLTALADTDLAAEERMLTIAQADFFLRYRDWWLAGVATIAPDLERDARAGLPLPPVERWFLYPTRRGMNLSAVAPFPFPFEAFAQRARRAAPGAAILVVYGLLFLVLGWIGARRFPLDASVQEGS